MDWTIPTSYCPSTPIGVGDFKRDRSQNILVGYPTLLTGRCGGTMSQGPLLRNTPITFRHL